MSSAASINPLESPILQSVELREEELDRERRLLEELVHPPPGPLIAVDLDDVLSQTNQEVADWHNENYGTDMKTSDFLYYYYWKNKYWGDPKETFKKVAKFYETDRIYQSRPVEGAKDGLEELKKLGYRLIIVTARSKDTADQSWTWVQKYFPGCFESIVCTGQFTDGHKEGHEVVTRLSKAQVCNDLKAVLLIDDSAENALQCATAEEPVPVLLFGDYEWNQRVSSRDDTQADSTFAVRFEREGGREFWKDEKLEIPAGAPLWRAANWSSAVQFVKERRYLGPPDETSKV
ncbi:hypothetical protein FA15DRAFT_713399 [Coprinopsis marcescibilis]|uniref:Uncharacterized protein n=1 Tax=Coprinopsis marcescibilis TaxID=230819 RepID=A0A5C3LFT8_COPMA|nr:hypothetical protein FA15DRAFT_713399 [Coprinopsis marcescibilis]